MQLRTPISCPAGRRLRVVIYARYSTEDQHPSSIPDQIEYCKKLLVSAGITDFDVDTLSDAEISGEVISRPGINRVRKGIDERRWELLLVEDSSRLYRHETECLVMVETAVDQGVRVIAINDLVDTAEPEWDDRLHEAARHHARTNKFTSFRIKRRLEALWEMGAAIGLLRPGYTRRPSVPATDREPSYGPHFDVICPEEAKLIRTAYEMMAEGDEPWVVGEWLTARGLRKCSNAHDTAYDRDDVNALIRRTIHRGHDEYRRTVSEKKFRSGKRITRRRPELTLTREMQHHRIVPDSLWYAANRKINDRKSENGVLCGDDHPLANMPRDSRFPLSKIFICDRCKMKMWSDGRNEGGYRCKHARSGKCWNKATAVRDLAHRQISHAVVDEMLALDGVVDGLVSHIALRLQDDQPRRQEVKQLRRKVDAFQRECKKLGEAIASCQGDDVPTTLITMLGEREYSLAEARAELEDAQETSKSPPQVTVDDIRGRISQTAEELLELDRSCGSLLGRLIDGKILAVPHQQFDSDKVVLRAEFDFRPVGILPNRLLAALSGNEIDSFIEILPAKRIVVDLFEPSLAPKHAMDAVKLKEESPSITLEKIGERLGISKRSAHLALQLGRKMQSEGIEDPYIRLTERPEKVARWK